MAMKKIDDVADQIYGPIERKIIATWLDGQSLKFTRQDDICRYREELSESIIGIKPDSNGRYSEFSISNAVARIALSIYRHQLFEVAVRRSDIVIDGDHKYGRQVNTEPLLPQLLFEVCWPLSDSFCSGLVSYCVSYLPCYDIYILVASTDNFTKTGYGELAFGCFDSDIDLLTGCEQVISDYWQYLYEEYGQKRWNDIFKTGIMRAGSVLNMGDAVWGKLTQDEILERLHSY